MSTHSTVPPADLNRITRRCLIAGAATLAVCVVGAFFDPDQFFRAYLASYLFYLGIGLGCLVILMIYYVTDGAWGFLIRRFLEAGTRTLPLLALLIIPVGCGLRYLFVWARPEEVAADPNLQWKQIYLNVPFWWGRAVLFFGAWLTLTYFLNTWSRRQEESNDGRYAWRLENLSGPGLVVYGICIHFAAVDWIMSLQTGFKSSMFGPLMASGQILSAFGFVLTVFAWLAARRPLSDVVSSKGLNDLGNLLLAILVIWAYLVFFQFMLVWMANLPHEAVWYVNRATGAWKWINVVLLVFHFVIPFLLLLQRAVKQSLVGLACTAGMLLLTQILFLDWQILPAFQTTDWGDHWMDFAMPIGLGGIWLSCYLWQLQQRPLSPRHDDNRAHALLLRQEDLVEIERELATTHG